MNEEIKEVNILKTTDWIQREKREVFIYHQRNP